MKQSLLISLYKLAEAISFPSEVHTTIGLAKKLGFSQQTTSRCLIDLQREGYIRREKQTRGEVIYLTNKGRTELKKMHAILEHIIHPEMKEIVFEGKVFSGLGEGAYYVSHLEYSKQFRQKLGFKPFPGTLNLRLDEKSIELREMLEAYPSVTIESFRNHSRTFGSVRCYKALLNGKVEAYLITAYRTHYGSDVLEVISPHNLRKALQVGDGDNVTVRVRPRPTDV